MEIDTSYYQYYVSTSDLHLESFEGYAHAKAESPRERLQIEGVKNLSNAELLAILIGTGNIHLGLSALDLARALCRDLS